MTFVKLDFAFRLCCFF